MLTNKVETKPIIQIDLEQWIPKDISLASIDMKEFLFKEMILKEAEFRALIEDKEHLWRQDVRCVQDLLDWMSGMAPDDLKNWSKVVLKDMACDERSC